MDVNGDPLHIFPRSANGVQQNGVNRRFRLEKYVESPLFDKKKQRMRKAVINIVKTLLPYVTHIDPE